MRDSHALARLSEHTLLQQFADFVRRDRRHTAELLATIAEIDHRRLWAKHACPSMFAFCVERFHMSESMAGKRIWAARTARRFPVILPLLARGELHLSAIVQLAKHLTADNHREVLARARHMSSREIERLVAELAPRPDAPSRIRAVPRASYAGARSQPLPDAFAGTSPRAAQGGGPTGAARTTAARTTTARTTAERCEAAGAPVPPSVPNATGASAAPGVAGRVTVLAPRRYKIEITVDEETHDRLRMLQDLMAHQLPGSDLAIIVSRAIERLLDDTLAKKASLTNMPGRGPGCSAGRTRAIPAAIRRAVWKRDGGSCTFVDDAGRRCRATRWIEYHHVTPYARGGRHEADNITLRCSAHNQLQADLDFGRGFMAGKRGAAGSVRQ